MSDDLTTEWDAIEREIAAIVAEVAELELTEVVPGLTLAELDVDSLELVEIGVEVERLFDLRFDEAELKDVTSIERLAELARAHGAGAS